MAEEEKPDWKTTLPEDLQATPSMAKFTDVAALAKGYVELEKTMGNSIRPPGPEASPEDKAAFFKKFTERFPGELVPAKDENALLAALGKPQKAEEYTLPKDLGDVPKEIVDSWRTAASELGLTKRQAEAALKKQFELYAAQQQQIGSAQSELKREWGMALEERTRLAAEAAERMGFPSEAVTVIRSGKGAASEMKAFYKMAQSLGLDKPANPMGQDGPGAQRSGMTPGEAMLQIEEIRKRPEYFNARLNPQLHQYLIKEVLRLQGVANPED